MQEKNERKGGSVSAFSATIFFLIVIICEVV